MSNLSEPRFMGFSDCQDEEGANAEILKKASAASYSYNHLIRKNYGSKHLPTAILKSYQGSDNRIYPENTVDYGLSTID